jgi:SSS family solute:Na+ symporter
MSIPLVDLVVIVVYLVGVTAAGLLSVRRRKLTGEVYFLAGRALPWGIVGAALFSSNISTIHLVGLAEAGYKHGLVIGNFEWMATFTLILLALVFAPFYYRTRISTLPEFLERRYGPAVRSIVAAMAIAAALLIHIGISLYAGAAVFREFFGVDVVVSIVLIAVITAIYTVVGGLRAVVITETIQTVVLLLGAVLVTGLAFAAPRGIVRTHVRGRRRVRRPPTGAVAAPQSGPGDDRPRATSPGRTVRQYRTRA